MRINQSNVFYNYTIGLAITDVDLLKTAKRFLKSGLTRNICFSDLKCLYIDHQGETQMKWVQPEGRHWDPSWGVKFGTDVPPKAIYDLSFSIEMLSHEQRIEAKEAKQLAPYFRAALPPIVLESGDLTLPLYAWIKIFSDGIVILSFQLDTTWEGIDEEQWISIIVNLFQYYFDSLWVDARIQRLDANHLIPDSFKEEVSIAGRTIKGRKSRKIIKKFRRTSKAILDESLRKDGKNFEVRDEVWVLHEAAGSEEKESWESTIDLCRSQYTNAIIELIVTRSPSKSRNTKGDYLWQGHPSISLMRFFNQPNSKESLLRQFSSSLSRILMRVPNIDNPVALPKDLRPFNDYCFHGNRGLLLWTWLRSKNEPDNAWEDPSTRGKITENQARAEHFEYHNMRLARANEIAESPPSTAHLAKAYETLASAENIIHKCSQASEISDALKYLLKEVGTDRLIISGKEMARWRLDNFRFRLESDRARMDRRIGGVFGLVGAAGLADLVIKPFLTDIYPQLSSWKIGLLSFTLAGLLVWLLIGIFVLISGRK